MRTRQKTILASAMAVIVLAVLLFFLLPPREAKDAARGREAAGETPSSKFGSETASHRQGEAGVIAAPPSMGDGDAELSGLVVSGGEVVEGGASVCARCLSGACTQEPEGTWCVRSDERGAFRLGRLVPGGYVLSAEAVGYRPAEDAPPILHWLEAAQKIDDIELQMEVGGGWIRGRVVDDLGRPIPNALVYQGGNWDTDRRFPTSAQGTFELWLESETSVLFELGRPIPNALVYQFGNSDTDRAISTSAQGAFELWLPGETSVVFEAPGHARGADRFTPPRDGVELVLSPGGAVRGRVVSEEGAPVEGVDLFFEHQRRPYGVSGARGRSGADGTFLVEGLGLGMYEVAAAGGRWYGGYGTISVTAGEVAGPLEIQVRRGAIVRGIVLDKENRTPCPEAFVFFKESEVGLIRGRADRSGRVFLEGVRPGTYEVSVRCGALVAAHPLPRIVVNESEAGEEYQWFVEPGSVLVGKVMDEAGRPVQGVAVACSALNDSGLGYGGDQSDAQGAFRIEGLPSATYKVYAKGRSNEYIEDVYVDVPHSEPILLTLLSVGTIEVAVVDQGGRPVVGAYVYTDRDSWPVDMMTQTDHLGLMMNRTDHDGRMKIGASPGPITLEATYPGFEYFERSVSEKRTVNVEAGRTVQARIELPHGGSVLAGVVVDGEGRPVIGAEVSQWPFGRGWGERSQFFSGSDGRFRIERLPAGRHDLFFRAPHGGSAVVWAHAPSENIRVSLTASAGLELEVRLEDGTIPGWFIVRADGGVYGEWMLYRGFDGALTIRDLSAGTWQLEVEARVEAGEFVWTGEADASADEIRKVSLVLRRGGIVSGRFVDAVSGQPVGGCCAYLRGDGEESFDWVGSNGLFEFRPVRPGTYRVTAPLGEGYRDYHGDPFEVPLGGVDLGDLRLTPIGGD